MNRSIIHFATYLLVMCGGASVLAQSPRDVKPDQSVTYKEDDKGDLKLHVFKPSDWKSSDQRPTIVFFFGGGWVGGTPSQFYPQAKHLAQRGIVAISAEYRTRRSHGVKPYECVADGRDAIRWVRTNAEQLGIDPSKIVASGGSAGGHVAACTAIRSSESAYAPASHVPVALVLFNPVIDTSPRGYGHKSLGEAWQSISPVHQVDAKIVPSIVFHGVDDPTVPISNARAYRDAVKKAGGRCQLVEYAGQKHGFFNYGRPSYADTIKKMDAFLDSIWSQ